MRVSFFFRGLPYVSYEVFLCTALFFLREEGFWLGSLSHDLPCGTKIEYFFGLFELGGVPGGMVSVCGLVLLVWFVWLGVWTDVVMVRARPP